MSFLGNLGKGLLNIGSKVAPFAAALIPGVGLPASMAIGGGLNALNKKVQGGSWGQALNSGLGGAANSALGNIGGNLSRNLGNKLAIQSRLTGGADQMRNTVSGNMMPSPGLLQRLFSGMSQFGNMSRNRGGLYGQQGGYPYQTPNYNPYYRKPNVTDTPVGYGQNMPKVYGPQ